MPQPFTGPTYALSSWQTDYKKPSHSHGYQFVLTYHVMTSSIHLSSFFCGLYFRGSGSVCENRENLHPAKISRYTVWYTSLWRFLEPPLFVCFLTFCSLRSNQFSDEGAHAVAAALQVNQNLQELKLVQPFMSYFFSFPLVGR